MVQAHDAARRILSLCLCVSSIPAIIKLSSMYSKVLMLAISNSVSITKLVSSAAYSLPGNESELPILRHPVLRILRFGVRRIM